MDSVGEGWGRQQARREGEGVNAEQTRVCQVSDRSSVGGRRETQGVWVGFDSDETGHTGMVNEDA